MATNDGVQRYLDAGVAFTAMTRKKAEELVAELVQNGDVHRGEAKARVDDLLERSKQSTEMVVNAIRSEVSRQLAALGITNLEDVAKQVAALLGRSGEEVKPAPAAKSSTKKTAPKKASAGKKATPKKAAAKKSAAASASNGTHGRNGDGDAGPKVDPDGAPD